MMKSEEKDMTVRAADIENARNTAHGYLNQINGLTGSDLNIENVHNLLKKAICAKLGIQDESDSIRNLIVVQIKQNDRTSRGLPDSVITGRIEKYDCHQTNLITQKKILLMMYIELELGITLDDDEAAGIQTVEEYSAAVCRLKAGGIHDD